MMQERGVNKRRIVKNTFYLYVRTILLMALSLYSSRILLKELGVSDYGVYNLVGSIVVLFSSLRNMLASATQRFLNYERNSGIHQVRNIFQVSVKIHYLLSIVFFVVAEIAGVWLISCKLNIPVDRIVEAHIVLQCSIVSSIAAILTVPYDAVIISNEDFKAYAYFAIFENTLKLAAAASLIFIASYKLIWYAVLILVSAIIVRIVNMLYCRRRFPECTGEGVFDRKICIAMGKFAGWNFLGNMSYSIYNEGINMILNIFGGVVANAARAIGYPVFHAVESLSGRLIAAVSPQAIQQYASGNEKEFYQITFLGARMMGLLYILIAAPICCFAPLVLQLWLGQVPEYTVSFIRVILIYGLLRTIHAPLDLCFKAAGRLSKYQTIEVCSLLCAVFIAYWALSNGASLPWAFWSMAIANVLNIVGIVILASMQLRFPVSVYLKQTIFPLLSCSLIIAGGCYSIQSYMSSSDIWSGVGQVLLIIGIIYWVGLNGMERNRIRNILKNR